MTAVAWGPAHSPPSRSALPAFGQAPCGQAYDYGHLQKWLRERPIRHRIARNGIEPSGRLGRDRHGREGPHGIYVPNQPTLGGSTSWTCVS